MSRLELLQNIIIAAGLLWALSLTLWAVGVLLYDRVQRHTRRMHWRFPIPPLSNQPKQAGG